MPEEEPSEGADVFRCPHCHAFSQQYWQDVDWSARRVSNQAIVGSLSRCSRCSSFTIWVDDEMYYPKASTAPHAHEEMPENVRRDFDEARLVLDDSPRAAAALLRLTIQRLMENHLGADGYSLDDEIGNLVEDGDISPRLQRALDGVRVIGNNSVHPGEMDMDDGRDTAESLFMLVNEIVDEAIARDIRIDDVYESLPDDYLEGIEDRDEE